MLLEVSQDMPLKYDHPGKKNVPLLPGGNGNSTFLIGLEMK